MPRINKKTAALEAALDIIAAEDVSGLTYDSLAQATGMSKSGLIYHFPTRHNLLVDCHPVSYTHLTLPTILLV